MPSFSRRRSSSSCCRSSASSPAAHHCHSSSSVAVAHCCRRCSLLSPLRITVAVRRMWSINTWFQVVRIRMKKDPFPRTPTPMKQQVESPCVRPLVPPCTTQQSCPTVSNGAPVSGCVEIDQEESPRSGNLKKTTDLSCSALDTTLPSDPFGFDVGEDVGPLQPLHPHHPDVVCHHDKPCSGRRLLVALQDSNELVALEIRHRVQVLNRIQGK